MGELIALPQPYPENRPWLDLRGHIGDSWQMSSAAWHFRGLLDGNTAHIHLRTARGTQAVLAEQLPEEFWPPGQLVIEAFTPGVVGAVGALLSADGKLTFYAPGMALLDGNLSNFVMQVSYARKVA